MTTLDGEGQKAWAGQSSGSFLDARLSLNPHLRVVFCSDDEILVKHGSRSVYAEMIRDDGRTRLIGRVLRGLVAPASLRELQERGVLAATDLPAATDLVAALAQRKILVDPATDLASVYLDALFGDGQGDRLRDTTLGLVGCGQLGTLIGQQLATLRPRGLRLLDPRPPGAVEQAFLGSDAAPPAGPSLGESLRTRLEGAGVEQLEVLEAGDIAEEAALARLLETVDFAVLACEAFAPTLLHALNEQALRHRRPWMSVYFDGSEAIVGPMYVPGETGCYLEYEIQTEATMVFKGEHLLYREELEERKLDASVFALPPYAMVAAGLAAVAVLRFLTGGQTFTIGRAIRLSFETMSIDFEDVFKLPRCPACNSDRPSYRHLFL
jgi:bacteriocin biosynthesis cyclodehydratase domain-containing protein